MILWSTVAHTVHFKRDRCHGVTTYLVDGFAVLATDGVAASSGGLEHACFSLISLVASSSSISSCRRGARRRDLDKVNVT